MSERNPQSWGELLNRLAVRIGVDTRVALPATVQSYDASMQTVDVKPLLRDQLENEDGELDELSLPVINAVPVVFPGAGGFRLTFPIAAGDTVLLVFSDRSIDEWQDLGTETTPQDVRRHALSDAIAIPGLHSHTSVWTGASTSGATLGKDGGPQAVFTASEIELNGSSQAILRGTAFVGHLQTFLTAVGAFGGLNLGTGGAALATAATSLFSSLSGDLSTTVKTG